MIPGFSGLPVLYLYFCPWICFEIKYDWLTDWLIDTTCFSTLVGQATYRKKNIDISISQ